VRRLCGLFLVCASLALVGVASPSPKPSPAPSASASIKPAATLPPAFGTPNVVVFPFQSPSDLDAKYGNDVAKIYVQTLKGTGTINVLPVPSNVKPEDYYSYARSQHADYYVSGYVQPIGGEASVVAHVVDVANDIMVYSATTMISSVPDVAAQALTARGVILQSAGVDTGKVAPSSAPTAAPAATSGSSISLNKVLDVFKGSKKTAAAATPAPHTKPSRGVIVAKLSGNAQPNTLNNATQELYRAMNVYYTTRLVQTADSNVPAEANSLCGTNRDNTIASGTLDARHVGGFRPHDVYTFTLKIYACFGATLYTGTQTDPDFAKAIRNAVNDYADKHPENNG
jgi:TolB-like protein